MKLTPFLLTFCVLLALVRSASADPLAWEADFGTEIAALTGNDDSETSVVLSFPFPFAGTTYTTVFVGNNGDLQLGTLGTDNNIDYDHWEDLGKFFNDGGFPVLAAFNCDLDLSTTGTVHFKDFGNRAVVTWNEVGTNEEEEHLLTFQIQLFPNGTIYFSYNGILDDTGEDLVTSLDEGILVGISGSTNVDPGVVDLSLPTETLTNTIYEAWNYTSAPTNALFDLDQQTLVFAPKTGGGFLSYILEPTPDTPTTTGKPVLDLLIGKSSNSLKGDGVRNPRNPSSRQTIEHERAIFTTNTSTAILVLQNDGVVSGTFRLRSSGDQFERMEVTAQTSKGGNVGAAIQTGRFSPTIPAGGSMRVVYRLRTERFYAGILRGGDRDDTIRFRLSGVGSSDNAAMINRYK